MKSTDKPSLIETVIASGANASYVRTIPKTQTKSGSGEMSLDLGWPPECAIPVAAGGKYPQMADANGVLNLLSAAVQQLQARFLGPYNAEFATAIGGYPLNAIVSDTTAGKFWVSTAEDNTTAPGSDGASWQDLFNGYATNTALNTETTNRTNADTDLQNQINNRVQKSGDTIDWLKVSGSTWNLGNQSVVYNSAVSRWTSSYVDSSGSATWDLMGGSPSSTTGNINWLRLDTDGSIRSGKGAVAFESDISNKYIGTNRPNTRFYCWNVNAASGDTINFPVAFTDVKSIVLSLTAQDTEGRGSWLTYNNLTTTSFTVFGRFMKHGNLDDMPYTQVSIMVYGW